jgi:small GTP-binding protein
MAPLGISRKTDCRLSAIIVCIQATMQLKRHHFGIFGRMNVGKSTIMNLLTQQDSSIADSTPGTTTDTEISFAELHGLGPVKLYDTAGYDEGGVLGQKKRNKVLADLKECDGVLLVINPAVEDFTEEQALLDCARGHDKQVFIVYNLFNGNNTAAAERVGQTLTCLRFHPFVSLKASDTHERPRLPASACKNSVPGRHIN